MSADTRECPRCSAMIWQHHGVRQRRTPGACRLTQAQCQAIYDRLTAAELARVLQTRAETRP